jgi:hypothetical protein
MLIHRVKTVHDVVDGSRHRHRNVPNCVFSRVAVNPKFDPHISKDGMSGHG